MSNVVEIHIAGGASMQGFHTDSHTGPVPEGVWRLLEYALAHTENLRGITFEFHESSYRMLGETGIAEQLDHARKLLNCTR
jgi:uncharacterized protein (UPF0276 family)